MKPIKQIAVSLILLLMITGPNAAASPTEVTGDIFVGLALPLSGPIAGLGNSMKNSAELAQQQINAAQLGSPRIRFLVEDSGGNPADAVAAFDRLIADGRVAAILGPATSSATAEAFPMAQAHGIVTLSPTAAAAGLGQIGDFVFLANLTVDAVVPGGVRSTHEQLGYRRVAVITDQDDLFSQSGLEILQDAFADHGIEILTTETFRTGDSDFSEQLIRIKESNPDAIFISTLPGEAAEILIQARQIEMPRTTPIIIPLAFSAQEVERAGEAAENVITFSTWDGAADTPGNREFVQRYRTTYDSEPNRFAAQWYAAVTLLATAIHHAGSVEPAALRDAMADLRAVDTILGAFSFDPDGGALFDPIIQIVRDGTLEAFE